MTTKTICILANSIKFGGRCIAGVKVILQPDGKWNLTNNWVRPLGHSKGGELSFLEYRLDNNKSPNILDIVEISLLRPANIQGQPEDWLIDPSRCWIYRGYFPSSVAAQLVESPPNLWLESILRNDRVSADYIQKHQLPSLYLIRPQQLEIAITEFIDDQGQSKKKRRARFIYNQARYDLALTDPLVQQKYFPNFPSVSVGPLATGPARDSILCVSLAPEFNGYHYKLAAAIIE